MPKLRRCWVNGCPIDRDTCPNAILHQSPSLDDALLPQWKDFCSLDPRMTFPKEFYICQFHFDPKVYHNVKLKTKRLAGALPTIKDPDAPAILTLKAERVAEANDFRVIDTKSATSHSIPSGTVSVVPEYIYPKENWRSFRDLRNAVTPFSVKVPSAKWFIMDFRHATPAKISFEYVELALGKSTKSITFVDSLLAKVTLKGENYANGEMTVTSISELEDLLKRVDELEARPCGCFAEWTYLRDLQKDVQKIKLPSSGWSFLDMAENQRQIIFPCFDEQGRLIRSVSFSLDLLPRVHIRNERCIEAEDGFKENVKCIHDVEKILESIASLRTCQITEPAYAEQGTEHGKPCQLILPRDDKWVRRICRHCFNIRKHRKLVVVRKTKRKTDKKELRSITKQLKLIEENNDKILFGSSRAVDELLAEMSDHGD